MEKTNKFDLIMVPYDFINKNQDVLKLALESAIPGHKNYEKIMQKVLGKINQNIMQCWISMKNDKINLLLITQVLFNDLFNERNLLLFCAFAVNKLESKDWDILYKKIYDYAKQHRFTNIIWYTSNEVIIKKSNEFGAITQAFCLLPVIQNS